MCAWYQKGKTFIQQEPIPAYIQIMNREQCVIQQLLEQQQFFQDFTMIRSALEQCQKMTHTQMTRWKRVQKVRNYITTNFDYIVEKCCQYSFKIANLEMKTQNNVKDQQLQLRYIHKSMDLLKFITSIDLLQDLKQPASKMQIQKRMTFHVFTRMMHNFLFCKDPKEMQNTLYPGYLLQVMNLLLTSKIHEIPLLEALKSSPQKSISIFTELHRFIQYGQICEIIKQVMKLKTSILIVQNNGVNYPVKNSQEQHPIRIKLAVCQELLNRLKNNITNYEENQTYENDYSIQTVSLNRLQAQIINTISIFQHIFVKYNEIPNYQQLIDLIGGKNYHFTILKIFSKAIQNQTQNISLSCFFGQIVSSTFALIKASFGIQITSQQNIFDLARTIKNILYNPDEIIIKPKLYHLKIFELFIAMMKIANMPENLILDLFINTKIFQFAFQIILDYSANNILIKMIDLFFYTVFFEKKVKIMEYLYSEFKIIEKTLILNDFKKQKAFGVIVNIIKTYTNMKIDTPIILQVIKNNMEKWNHFKRTVLQPYVNLQQNSLLGLMQYPKGSKEEKILSQIEQKTMNDEIIVTDCRNSFMNQSIQMKLSMVSSFSVPKSSGNEMKQPLDQQALSMPIQLSFDEKKEQNQQGKDLKSSLESFSQIQEQSSKEKGGLKQMTDFQNKETHQKSSSSYQEFIEKSKSKIQFSSKSSRINSLAGQKQKKRGKMKSVDSRKKNRWEVAQNEDNSYTQNPAKPKINSLPKQLKIPQENRIPIEQLQKYSKIRIIKITQKHKPRNKTPSTERVINPERDSKIFNLLKILNSKRQRLGQL